MSYLKVTLIDVGWGDSILVEASSAAGRPRFALIDSNDNAERDYWPSWNFLRKHFGLREDEFDTSERPFFDFVMLTHDHSDHGSGLKRIMKEYGTRNFWYPKVVEDESVVLTSLQKYADHPKVKINHQDIDTSDNLGMLGEASMRVLWPPPDHIEPNPNNNSIVLALSLGGNTILLTGDAEGKVWEQIAGSIPSDTRAFKVPHHGSRNGTLYNGGAPWLDATDALSSQPHLGISCHPNYPNRFDFPHADVIAQFDGRSYPYYRTDKQYHITFTADDNGVSVRYSH